MDNILGFMNSPMGQGIVAFAMKVLFVLIAYIIGAKLIKLAIKILVKSLEKANADKGLITFIASTSKFILYAILLFVIAGTFGVDSATIAALFASMGVAIGLALQGSLSNLAGGVLILLLKPFKVGDYIKEDSGLEGIVTEIEMFYTKLKTADNKIIIMPNGNLSNHNIVNFTSTHMRRVDVLVGIDYSADLKLAKKVLIDMLLNEDMVLKNQEIVVFVNELNSSSVDLNIRCWVKTEDYWTGLWKITEEAKYVLDANSIAIPFPQLDVKIKQ